MKLTEAQLRSAIRSVLTESAEGPTQLKQGAQSAIAAINDDNPASFWEAFLGVIEGLAGTVQHAPGADNQERSKFVETLRPVAKFCNQLRNAYRQQAKDKRTESVVREVIEPFEPALISQLRKVNAELEDSAYDFDDAGAEIRAAHTAITALVKKLQRAPTNSFGKRKSGTFVRSPTAAVAAEGKTLKKRVAK